MRKTVVRQWHRDTYITINFGSRKQSIHFYFNKAIEYNSYVLFGLWPAIKLQFWTPPPDTYTRSAHSLYLDEPIKSTVEMWLHLSLIVIPKASSQITSKL